MLRYSPRKAGSVWSRINREKAESLITAGRMTAAGLAKTLGASVRPIPVNAELLVYLDQTKRLDFLKQWQAAIKGGK